MKILVRIQDVELAGELNDSPTANAIADALPLEGDARVWGEEIYFDIPVIAPLEENAVAEVEIGTLAYWPTGSAFCIFFGPTPVSTNDKPRAYSPVNVIGCIVEDTTPLRTITDGAPVSVATRR